MFKKFALSAAIAASAMTVLPTAASAQSYGYYDRGGYDQRYDRRYDPRYDSRYDRRHDSRRYDNRRYDNRRYNDYRYSDNRRSCSGTVGTILGAAAGALLGREIDRGGSNRYGRRDSGTTGLIIGGAAGALAGRAIDKSSC